jgi:hypothetical protein
MTPEKIKQDIGGGVPREEGVVSPENIIKSVYGDPAVAERGSVGATQEVRDARVDAEMAKELEGLERLRALEKLKAPTGINPLEIKAAGEFEAVTEEEIDTLFAKVEAGEPVKTSFVESAEKARSAAQYLLEEVNRAVQEKSPLVREKIEAAGNWYKKQPLKYKVLASVGLIGAASASAMVGGTVGTAIATAAFTGSFAQRTLGGIATFLTTEGVLKKAAEKKGRERTKWEARRHMFEAATLGLLTGSGAVAGAAKNVSEMTGLKDFFADTYHYWFPKEDAPAILQNAVKPMPTAEVLGGTILTAGDYTETAQAGDSVWKLAKHQLEAHFGQRFTDMTEAQKNYLIDTIKDRVAEDPEKFGLTDVDKIAIGQKIDFSGAFQDQKIIEGAFDHVGVEASGSEAVPDIGAPVASDANLEASFNRGFGAPETSSIEEAGRVAMPAVSEGVPVNIANEIAAGNFEHVPPEIIQKTDQAIAHDIEKIYSWKFLFFGGSQIEEWEIIKAQDASAILETAKTTDAAFGAPTGGVLDGAELANRQEMQDYLKNLVVQSGVAPTGGEKVEDFIKRAAITSLMGGESAG